MLFLCHFICHYFIWYRNWHLQKQCFYVIFYVTYRILYNSQLFFIYSCHLYYILMDCIGFWWLNGWYQWTPVESNNICSPPSTYDPLPLACNGFSSLPTASDGFQQLPVTSSQVLTGFNGLQWLPATSTHFLQHPTWRWHRHPTTSIGVCEIPPTSSNIQHRNNTDFQQYPLEFSKFHPLPAISNMKMVQTSNGIHWSLPNSAHFQQHLTQKWHPLELIGFHPLPATSSMKKAETSNDIHQCLLAQCIIEPFLFQKM